MNDTLLVVMTVFVVISAIALCIQAVMLIGMKKTTQSLHEQVTAVLPQVKSVLAKAEATIDENRRNIADVTAKASEIAATASQIAAKANSIMDVGKAQAAKWDVVLTDASERAKVQIQRAELVVDDTVGRVHHSVTAVHNGVMKPIREIQGLTAGLRAAMQHLMRGGRPSVADATHDDEMFIG